jgi:hypothetical protein
MTIDATEMIDELLDNPQKFNDDGRAYQLLQLYFRGAPIDTLRPLLAHEEPLVRRAALFVTSELGSAAGALSEVVAVLIGSGDRYESYHSIEIVSVCARDERVYLFAHVVKALGHNDPVIRSLAVRMILRAEESQLSGALQALLVAGNGSELYPRGLAMLLEVDERSTEEVASWVRAEESVARTFGVLAVCRRSVRDDGLVELVSTSADVKLREYVSITPSSATRK